VSPKMGGRRPKGVGMNRLKNKTVVVAEEPEVFDVAAGAPEAEPEPEIELDCLA
jgi:hypothetical protein